MLTVSILCTDYTYRLRPLLRKAGMEPLNSGLPLVDGLCQRSITCNRFLQGVKTVRLWWIKWVNVARRWLSFTDTACEKPVGTYSPRNETVNQGNFLRSTKLRCNMVKCFIKYMGWDGGNHMDESLSFRYYHLSSSSVDDELYGSTYY